MPAQGKGPSVLSPTLLKPEPQSPPSQPQSPSADSPLSGWSSPRGRGISVPPTSNEISSTSPRRITLLGMGRTASLNISPSFALARRRLLLGGAHATEAKQALEAAIDHENEKNGDPEEEGSPRWRRLPVPPLLSEDELQAKKAHALKGIRKLLQAQKDKEQADKRRLLDFLSQSNPDYLHTQLHKSSYPSGGQRRGSRTVDTTDEADLLSTNTQDSDHAAVIRLNSSSEEDDSDDDDSESEPLPAQTHRPGSTQRSRFKLPSLTAPQLPSVFHSSNHRGGEQDQIQLQKEEHHRRLKTPLQQVVASQAHKALKGINMKHRMNLLRHTAHQALAKHAARQALKRGLKAVACRTFPSAAPPRSPVPEPPPDRLLLMKQAVKEALLRSHNHENMSMVAQELLASAARKNWKKRATLTLQRVARGFLVRLRLLSSSQLRQQRRHEQ